MVNRPGASVPWSVTVIVAVLTVLLLNQSAGAGELPQPSWGWFSAISVIDNWFMLTGKAKVAISGTSFVAELYDSRDNELAITLKGKIVNGRLDVVAVRLSTDDSPRRLTGVYKKLKWRDASAARESVLLTEPGEPAGLTIGLTREVK